MSDEILTEDQYIESMYPQRGANGKAMAALLNKYSHLMKEGWSYDQKRAVAVLAENYKRLYPRELTEEENTTNLPLSIFPVKFAFPLISQVFPELVALKLASVQPMNAPIGKVFYKSWMTDNNTANQTSGQADASLTHTGSGTIIGELPAPNTIKRGRVQFSSATVTAQKWMMQARWSTEVQEDAQAMIGLDIESDLLKALAEEIQGEIDYTVLNDMVANAAFNTVYDGTPLVVTGSDSTTKVSETLGDARKRLYKSVLQAADKVYKSRFVQPNYIVGSPTGTEYLRQLDDFAIDANYDTSFNVGVRYFGTFAGKYKVYTAPQFPNDTQLLLGVQGQGYIYAPYIAMEVMPGWYNNDEDEWVRNLRTRAARFMALPQLFSTVTIQNAV